MSADFRDATLADTFPSPVRKYLAARFVNYYELNQRIIGVLAGSALNSDWWIENGRLRAPVIQGGEWSPAVVPRNTAYAFPITPERAVELVGRATGARTTNVPRLLLPSRHLAAAFARWEIQLDQPIEVIETGTGVRHTITWIERFCCVRTM